MKVGEPQPVGCGGGGPTAEVCPPGVGHPGVPGVGHPGVPGFLRLRQQVPLWDGGPPPPAVGREVGGASWSRESLDLRGPVGLRGGRGPGALCAHLPPQPSRGPSRPTGRPVHPPRPPRPDAAAPTPGQALPSRAASDSVHVLLVVTRSPQEPHVSP